MKKPFKHISIILMFAAIGFGIKYVVNYMSNLWIKEAMSYMPEPIIYHWSIWVMFGCLIISMISLAIHAKLSGWNK